MAVAAPVHWRVHGQDVAHESQRAEDAEDRQHIDLAAAVEGDEANRAAIQEKPAAQSKDSTACVMWFSVSTLCQQKPWATTMNIGTAQAAFCTDGMPACTPS